MRVDIGQFGTSLVSRPAGREAALALQANVLRNVKKDESIELDFGGVLVLTPSWGDEFMGVLHKNYGGQITVLPCDNPSVLLTLKTIAEGQK